MNTNNMIPKSFSVGGQHIDIQHVDICEHSDLGNIVLGQGVIQIANTVVRGIPQSDTSKLNTFYHELTHAILKTMGEYELNNNERFVCTFSGFLTEAMLSMKYE